MAIPPVPNRHQDSAAHRQVMAERINQIRDFTFDDSRVRTLAEITGGVMPVNFAYPPGYPKRHGAVGDGATNDTAALLRMIAAMPADGGQIYFDAGATYAVDSTTLGGLQFSGKTNFKIFGNGATIKVLSGQAVTGGYYVLSFLNCRDGDITELTVDSNRAGRTPANVGAFGIVILTSSARLTFFRCFSDNSVVDGWTCVTTTESVFGSYPADITLLECGADNAYRNGISPVASVRFHIKGGAWTNTNGTAPENGIDPEPDASTQFGNSDLLIEDVDVSGNAGYGIGLAGIGGSAAPNTRVTLKNIRGLDNTLGLIAVGNVNGLDVDGVHCGPHSAATRGLIDLQAGDVGDISLRNLNFRGVSINSTSKYLIYVHSGVDSRVHIDGLRVFDCSNIRVLSANQSVTLLNTELEFTPDLAIQLNAVDCVVRSLVSRACGGIGVYVGAADCELDGLKFVDCLNTNNYNVYVASGGTSSVVRNINSVQTVSIPAGAVSVFYDAVPRYADGITGHSAGSDFTGANIVTFNVGTTGAHIANIKPDPFKVTGTWDPANIIVGAQDAHNFTVTGATVLDRAFATTDSNLNGLTISAYVSAANTVTVVLANNTAAPINIANSNWSVWVEKR